jgi:hypothetical protein
MPLTRAELAQDPGHQRQHPRPPLPDAIILVLTSLRHSFRTRFAPCTTLAHVRQGGLWQAHTDRGITASGDGQRKRS